VLRIISPRSVSLSLLGYYSVSLYLLKLVDFIANISSLVVILKTFTCFLVRSWINCLNLVFVLLVIISIIVSIFS
jgi:hypothetical protein